MNILGPATIPLNVAKRWAKRVGSATVFVELSSLYWRYGPERGVRPEIAYVQAAWETGYGKFGGVLDESFYNPCGLKNPRGGDDFDPNAHFRFPNWDVGVIAHIDHLALYAGAPGYPREDSPDPRHNKILYGCSPSVEGLGGKWAPNKNYGDQLISVLYSIK